MVSPHNKTGKELPLMEAFYTIQGEGFHQGKAAYFIRLGGCDVGCHWCDVKESWDASVFEAVSVEDIVSKVLEVPTKLAVITGGEPLMYDLTLLTKALKEKGIQTNIETSGAYPLTGNWDWVCFSPKKFKAPVDGFGAKADELKVIVYNKSDFSFAEKHQQMVGDECKLYLQPEYDKSEEMLPLIIDYVKKNPRWQISLQTHKFLNIP